MTARPDHHATRPPLRRRGGFLEKTGDLATDCVHCRHCVKECAFLRKHGTPGHIARQAVDRGLQDALAFECSLCGMCSAVCPHSLKPAEMFLEMRRASDRRSRSGDVSSCVYLGFEKRGISPHLTYYALPKACSTVLFPGCALSATRPEMVLELFTVLRRKEPSLGMVLDCCTKPSHDLGRSEFFESAFGEMRRYLLSNGVRRVLTACPSCYKVFKTHGGDLMVETVYEVLAAEKKPVRIGTRQTVTIHDPCPLRFNEPIQSAVRTLASAQGLDIEEMPHHGARTFCCGEGASVSCTAPELAETWGRRRAEEAQGRQIITYCAGCDATLGKIVETRHILDILFPRRHANGDRRAIPGFPRTCWNRLRLKHYASTGIPAAVRREGRTIPQQESMASFNSPNWWSCLISRWTAILFSAWIWIGKFRGSKN
ncbi:MAG: (Fe-S)-binding protein [Desulfobacteraceae bacterium]|jgi:Fe-S oxidoreductase